MNSRITKLIIALAMGCMSALCAQAELVTVTLQTAGTLTEQIAAEQKLTITELKVNGPINGADVLYIREMAGQDASGTATDGKLVKLDLSEASIVTSTDVYYSASKKTYTTTDNVIGQFMFYQTNLTSVDLPSSITAIQASAFRGCKGLVSIDIPASVTTLGSQAFNGCTSLTSIEIPEKVTEISSNAFKGCTALTGVYLPDNVTVISTSAFSGCTGLVWVNIGNAVTEIDDTAFGGLTKLERFTIRSATPPTTMGNDVFKNSSVSTATLYVPEGTEATYKAAAQWSAFGTFVEGTPTGIEEVAGDEAVEVARYDINGRVLAEPVTGINIVRMSNGTVRKEIVK